MFVLDTDLISLLEWEGGEASQVLRSRLAKHPPTDVVTTIITFEEQMRGWFAKMAKARTIEDRVDVYRRMRLSADNYKKRTLLDFDLDSALRCEELRRLRLHIGTQDLKIAAICLRHDATLLTRNLRDFRRVPGLKAEDWSK